MNNELGSIMYHCYQAHPVNVYVTTIPENIVVPSLYFAPPLVVSTPFLPNAYQKRYTLTIQVFDTTSDDAHRHAERIADALRAKRHTIRLVDESGALTSKFKRLEEIEVRLVDDGVAQITIDWSSRYSYDKDIYQKMMKVFHSYPGEEPHK